MKLYYTVWAKARIVAMHEKFLELGLESPYSRSGSTAEGQDERITTRIDISDHADVRGQALLAHRTQIDPASPFWFGLPPEEAPRPPLRRVVLAGRSSTPTSPRTTCSLASGDRVGR
jgi:mycothiol S-conjugate amidase